MNRTATAAAIVLALAAPAMAQKPLPQTTPSGVPVVALLIPDATCYADHLTAYVKQFKVQDLGAGEFLVSVGPLLALADPATRALGWKSNGACDDEHSGGHRLILTDLGFHHVYQSSDFSLTITGANGMVHGTATFHE